MRHRWRRETVGCVVVLAIMGASTGSAAAQPGDAATLVGQVVQCRHGQRPMGLADQPAIEEINQPEQMPGQADQPDLGQIDETDSGQADQSNLGSVDQAAQGQIGRPDPLPLEDVTPVRRKGSTAVIRFGVPDMVLRIDGTAVTTRTGTDGWFTLSGAPADQPLSLQAQFASGTSLVLDVPGVAAGQTRDLGMVGPPGCGGSGAVLTNQRGGETGLSEGAAD